MINPTDTDRMDADIRARYPYPLAATYYRAFNDAPDLATIHEYLLDLFEIALKYCAAIALAQYVRDGNDDPAINKSLQDLQRPSLGHWQGWLRDILRLYERQRRELLVPELAIFYRLKNNTELFRATMALRQLMTEQMDYRGTGNPAAVTTQEFFELLGTYRNKLAHGARLNNVTKERVANLLMPAMRELFISMNFLADYRLIYLSEVKLAVGPVRRGPRHFDHYFTFLVGDRPRVSRVPKTLDEEQAVDPVQIYLLAKNQDFYPLLSLHPFLIYRYCERCSTDQTYVLNMSRDNDLLTYLSYQCTHQFSVTGLMDDLNSVISPEQEGGLRPLPAPPPVGIPSPGTGAWNEPYGTPPYTSSPPLPAGVPPPQPVLCPHCYRPNPPGKKFCTTCGTPLAASPPVPLPPTAAGPGPVPGPGPATAVPPSGPALTMPLGPAFGAVPVPDAPPTVIPCPHCGHANLATRPFCTSCGQPIAGVTPASPPSDINHAPATAAPPIPAPPAASQEPVPAAESAVGEESPTGGADTSVSGPVGAKPSAPRLSPAPPRAAAPRKWASRKETGGADPPDPADGSTT